MSSGSRSGRRARARPRSTRRARAAPRGSRRSRRRPARRDRRRRAPRRAASRGRRGTTTEIGVAFDGAPAGASTSRGRGVSRSQPTSPSWQSRSSARGVVAAQPAAEQLGLPRDRRGLAALQLLDDRGEPGLARELGAGRDVLPAQQEAHEVLRGRGLDAAAPARSREYECMRASSRRATHSPSSASAGVAALQREALVLEHREPGRDRDRPRARVASPSAVDGGDAGDLEVTAQRPRRSRRRRRRAQPLRVVDALGRAPQLAAAVLDDARPRPRVDELVPQRPATPGAGGISTSEHRRSCRSSAVSGSGVISSCTRVDRVAGRARRSTRGRPRARAAACTALVRRFCSSSSSRNAYGRAVRISCASTDGSVVSTQCTRDLARLDALEQRRAGRRRRAPRAACRRSSGARARGRGSRSARRRSPGRPRPAGTPRP